MESADAVEAKRRVLIDALMMCLSKSRIMSVVDGKTVRGVLDSASTEMWREGEFRLDPIWKVLIAQPGLSAEQVAPPLLVFKAYEKELGVAVRVPQALSAIPRGEQVRLRDALGIQRADFAQAIDTMKTLAAEQQVQQMAAREAAADEEPRPKQSDKPTTGAQKKVAKPINKALAAGLAIGALAALGVGVWFTLRDTSVSYDLADVAGTLQLTKGRAAGPSLTATIADPKWEAAKPDERKRLAGAVMDLEVPKGIRSLILLDGAGATRAMVNETADGRMVLLP